MAMSAEHRSKFAALHRQWWRLHMSEKFSSGTINSKQTNNHYVISVRLPDEATIFTAEAYSIWAFLNFKRYTYYNLFRLSFLFTIYTLYDIDHPYIIYILCNCLHASRQGKIGISFGFQATLEFTAIVKLIALQNLHSSLKLLNLEFLKQIWNIL